MPETIKLLESTENEITEDKNSVDVLLLEVIEVILVQCKIFNNDCKKKIQEFCMHLFQINHLVDYWKFHQQISCF